MVCFFVACVIVFLVSSLLSKDGIRDRGARVEERVNVIV